MIAKLAKVVTPISVEIKIKEMKWALVTAQELSQTGSKMEKEEVGSVLVKRLHLEVLINCSWLNEDWMKDWDYCYKWEFENLQIWVTD